EGGEVRLARQRRRGPGAPPRGEIAGQLEQTHLLLRLLEKGNELLRGGAVLRAAEDDQARAAGHGDALRLGGGERRQRRRRPLVLHLRRQLALELADVPRPGDVHGEVALPELLVEVRDQLIADRGRVAAVKGVDVEGERARELGTAERATRAVRREQRGVARQRQHQDRLELVRREEDGVARAVLAGDALHGVVPLAPRARPVRIADRGQ